MNKDEKRKRDHIENSVRGQVNTANGNPHTQRGKVRDGLLVEGLKFVGKKLITRNDYMDGPQ